MSQPMATPAGLMNHTALKLYVDGATVVVQPSTGQGKLETLVVNPAKGTMELLIQEPMRGKALDIFGIIGMYKLHSGSVMAVITGAQEVAVINGSPVYRVTESQLVQNKEVRFTSAEKQLLETLRHALDPEGAGRNLFFSYGADLTLHTQKQADVLADAVMSAKQLHVRADKRFFWNKHLSKPLVDAGADRFVLTMVLGSVAQLPAVTVRGASVSVALIARRSAQRAGTRHWRRGADPDGAAANFVETEQLVVVNGGATVASFVQIRGSIPLLWTQLPNIKYKPPTKICLDHNSAAAFDKHMLSLIESYKSVIAINLVNQHGSEGKLAAAMKAESDRFRRTHGDALSYVAFDFHAECGATRYHNLSKLMDQVVPGGKLPFGLFLQEGGKQTRRQVGIHRTNCIDCLDRTNVVQGLLGRRALEAVLLQAGLLPANPGDLRAAPELEAAFKNMWADHGDDISRQYAGTGALKSLFTRTGKRSVWGLLDDGVKSVSRYYLNNFQDGRKQDSFDLVTGAYDLPAGQLKFSSQFSPVIPLLAVCGCVYYALGKGLPAAVESFDQAAAARELVAPLAAAGVLLLLVVRNGRHLVNRPQLCPQLANTLG